MPIYSLYNIKTQESHPRVFMHMSEYMSYDERDEKDRRIYTGDEFEYEEHGDMVFVMTTPAIAGTKARPPAAQKSKGRGLADKRFGRNKWV